MSDHTDRPESAPSDAEASTPSAPEQPAADAAPPASPAPQAEQKPDPKADPRAGQPPAQAAPADAPSTAPAAKPPEKTPEKTPAEQAAATPAPTLDAQTNAEIDAAMAEMEAAPAPKKKVRGPRVVQGGREHRKGRVVSVGPADIFIEFGPKELGVAPRAQWPDENELPKVDEVLEVVIDRYNANESLFVCSRPGAVQKADWELLQPGQVVEAQVTGSNKGGLELEVAQHRAFMPASQVDLGRIEDLSVFHGQKLECEVQKVDRAGKGNIVLTRRKVLEKQRDEARDKLRGTLSEGDVIEGEVKRIADFGAFVEIAPGLDGLIHISDLAHDRVRKVEDVVDVGKRVKVKVVKTDWDKNRIGLSLKATTEDPYTAAADTLKAGEVVTGKVTSVAEFGCFVEIAPGVEGLVHISELDWKRVPSVDSVVKPDQVVQVKILEVDEKSRRVSLSIKQTREAPAGTTPRGDEMPEHVETAAMRKMKEKAKGRERRKGLKSGLGSDGSMGMGLGDLQLPG